MNNKFIQKKVEKYKGWLSIYIILTLNRQLCYYDFKIKLKIRDC